MIKTRFAPSPTGAMHLGNVRTALFSYLLAKSLQGNFLFRVEDTDMARSEDCHVETIASGLRWLGLNWEEGPYFQSKRLAIYQQYYQQLQTAGIAYPCFCSEESLALSRKTQLALGKPPRYAGTCKHLTQDEINTKLTAGLKPTLRFSVPAHQGIKFLDLVKGPQHFNSDHLGDFIIRRANGMPSFIFCNAVDDSLMEVTHVIRGEDHLTNTPRQLLVLEALGLVKPQYGHISLVTAFSGDKLSKRHGSVSLQDLKADGILPNALLNYMARMGHSYENNNLMKLEELIKNFNIETLGKSPAKFDKSQLEYWQKQALVVASETELREWMGVRVLSLVPEDRQALFMQNIRSLVLFPGDALSWANIFYTPILEYSEDASTIIKSAGSEFYSLAIAAFHEASLDSAKFIHLIKTQTGKSKENLFFPLRVAFTGITHGPDFKALFSLMRKEDLENRLIRAEAYARIT